MNFEEAVDIILKFEGGYVNDPKDPGGETNFGISKRAFPEYDIKALTEGAAKQIYKIFYWDKMQCNRLPDYMRLMIFDTSINQGVFYATKMLQEAVRTDVDGVIGPTTISAAITVDRLYAISYMSLRRHKSYSRSEHWINYGAGWMRRLLEISILCSSKI